MKKRRRSRSRKSSGPASPSRSGEPTSPCRSGESASPDRSGEAAASSDRSGERAFSSSADPDREDGDGSIQHRMSQDGDGAPSGEGASSASAAPDPVVPASPAGSALPNIDHNANFQVTALRRDFSFISGKPASSAAADYMDQWLMEKHKKERESSAAADYRDQLLMEKHEKEREMKKIREGREGKKIQEVKERKERKKEERKKRKKEKQREKEKQILSDLHMQHDGALVIEESSTALEQQQQQQTSSLSPNPFADLQDAGEASETSAAPPSGNIKGKRVGHEGRRKKISSPGSTHASPPREEKSIKQKGCLHDSELLMDQTGLHASHGSSRSEDAQEDAPYDEVETSSVVDKKPIPRFSGDCGKIAQNEDEDGHSDKSLSSLVEDEQHSDKVGIHATIEYHKQEQDRARRHVQALLDIDNDKLSTEIGYYLRQLNYDCPKKPYYSSTYEPQQLIELYQRLALYRIRGYELSMDRKLDKLDDANLAQHFPPDVLYNEAYFKNYEDSLEWYFDPKLCKYSGFEDYQRLVLYNDGEYRDWDCYRSTLHTYEEDLAYVQYCEAMEKWVEDYLVDCLIPAISWERIKDVAHLQALKIAAGFPNVSPTSVSSAFAEHMWSLMFDFSNYMGLDGVYFEIWKRVAKQKMDFREALSELYQEKMFPLRSYDIEQELEENPLRRWPMKENYDAYVASIGDLVSDDQALPLIAEAVKNMCPKSKNYVDYARKKLEVAKEICLIMEGTLSLL